MYNSAQKWNKENKIRLGKFYVSFAYVNDDPFLSQE